MLEAEVESNEDQNIGKHATLQEDSKHRSCDGLLYFSNAEIITQHVGDHWGGVSARQKEGKETHRL